MGISLEDIRAMKKAKRKAHKFGAVRCQRDQINFPSKLERRMYDKLCLLQKSGEIVGFLRQPGFDIPGGKRHYADFLIFWADGTCTCIDTKGKDTEAGKLKRACVHERYPWIKIEIVTEV